MTDRVYYQDAYKTEFEAQVLSCQGGKKGFLVTLDKTAFYPEGGGQPADTGTLGGVAVWDVHEKDGMVIHYTDAPLTVGESVNGKIDWDRRFDLMQNHSGEHILSGVICKKYSCDNVGFHMGKDKIIIDFNGKIPETDLDELEEIANKAIWQNEPFAITYPDGKSLQAMDYRSKIELSGEVRIVRCGEYDCCACCGTHVKNAGEIGIIKIVNSQNYKGGTRLEIVSGKRALLHYRGKNNAADAVGRVLSVQGEKIFPAVENVLAEREELIQALNRLKWESFQHKTGEIPADIENVLYLAEGLGGKDMTHFADALAEKSNGRAMVMTATAEGFAFVLLSRKQDAREITEELKQSFDCKGGGKPDGVQGRLSGEKKKIFAFFQEKGFFIKE